MVHSPLAPGRAAAKPRGRRDSESAVAVLGAGPYGLAIASHLIDAGIETRVFGEPLSFWRQHMPEGMLLRSPWRGSHIADPHGSLTLDSYAAEGGFKPVEQLPISEFIAYACWFQRRAVPYIESRKVIRIEKYEAGFRLITLDGELFYARRLVIATGLLHQEHRPPEFAGIPAALASHSSEHRNLSRFGGRRMAVIGGGQSAVEIAVLLREAGCEVQLVSRTPIKWLRLGESDLLRERLSPPSPMGPLPLSHIANSPRIMHALPRHLRQVIARRCVRPAASGWLKERSAGIRFNSGRRVISVTAKDNGVVLHLDNGCSNLVDHVILATGFKVNIFRLGLLAETLLEKVDTVRGTPVLSRTLESSVPGLYFAGCYAVWSLGPLMRFIWGAGYAARAITSDACSLFGSKHSHAPHFNA